jgi:DNA mismatch endonuclease (patch repair protein)
MSRVRGKHTKVEMAVRRLVYSLGHRYRLHSGNLPGRPDLVFRSRRAVIFIHGCFWHRHPQCKLARLPKSRLEFWVPKLESNRERDARNQRELTAMGWRSLVVWECETRETGRLARKIRRFLAAQHDHDRGVA